MIRVSNEMFLDLTKMEKGCTRTPVVRLIQGFSSLKRGMKLKVLFNEKDIPVKVFKILVKERDLRIESFKKVRDAYEVLLTK